MFLEKWAAAKGYAFESAEINTWRREHMSDLTEFFDFAHPDLSHVQLPNAPTPHTDPLTSMLDGAEWCQAGACAACAMGRKGC
jgi:phospholipase C